jgi:hypothetical protein
MLKPLQVNVPSKRFRVGQGRWAGSLILMHVAFFPTYFFHLGRRSLSRAGFAFLALLIKVPAPDLPVTMPDESASGSLAKIGTIGIGDFVTSLKPGTWEKKLFKAWRELETG